ncbi:hypothetical protein [Streptomyces sp. NPDC058486]|uniref:hypothetical protein n=1 Tax=unclassified Streptomyces TaxID=2593676 RepID=UPI003656E500
MALHECDEDAVVRLCALIESGVPGPSKQLFDLVLDVIPAPMTYGSKVCGSEWIMVPLVPVARGRGA